MTRVSELMTKDVIHSVRQDFSVAEAAKRMRDVQRGCLVIVEGGRLVGILTERDIVQRVVAQGKSPESTMVSEVMSKPVISVGPEALVSDAANVMIRNKIRRLPITEGTDVVGMITVTDFAKFLYGRSLHDPMLAALARASAVLANI